MGLDDDLGEGFEEIGKEIQAKPLVGPDSATSEPDLEIKGVTFERGVKEVDTEEKTAEDKTEEEVEKEFGIIRCHGYEDITDVIRKFDLPKEYDLFSLRIREGFLSYRDEDGKEKEEIYEILDATAVVQEGIENKISDYEFPIFRRTEEGDLVPALPEQKIYHKKIGEYFPVGPKGKLLPRRRDNIGLKVVLVVYEDCGIKFMEFSGDDDLIRNDYEIWRAFVKERKLRVEVTQKIPKKDVPGAIRGGRKGFDF